MSEDLARVLIDSLLLPAVDSKRLERLRVMTNLVMVHDNGRDLDTACNFILMSCSETRIVFV